MPSRSFTAPTIKEIAATLGLSHSTVSRALNDHPAISDLTKKRVNAEASRAGYVANNAARMLKQERSHVLGLVIPDIKNAFYTSVAQIVAEAAVLHGWQMILATTDDDSEREMRAVRSLLEARAEGVMISPSAKPLSGTITMLNRLHTVQLLRTVRALGNTPSVVVDDALGIELATSHLLAQGHKRIGYIGSRTTLSTGRNRLRGYEKSLKKNGILVNPELCAFGPARAVFGAQSFLEIMSRALPPTAIVIAGPELAEGVLVEAVRRKIRIPSALSIVSYGEMSWHQVIPGGITCIRLPEKEIARAAFERLISVRSSPAPNKLCIKPCLIERGSSSQLLQA